MAKNQPSELRYDIVARDWVVVATGRARKPDAFAKNRRAKLPQGEKYCPFEDLSSQEHPTLMLSQGKELAATKPLPKDWTTVVLPNKYPAFSPKGSFVTRMIGPYEVTDGLGFHEVIVTKDHKKDIPQMSLAEVTELIEAYERRYRALKDVEFVNYISLFKNKGPAAGASVAHPHSQLMAIPVLDPDIQRSLESSKEFFEEHDCCIHCAMLSFERADKKRIVYETDCFLLLAPFAPRVSFELRVYPKKHSAFFESISSHEKECFAKALQTALKKLHKGLKDPDYNYYIHTAPADAGEYGYYHWHLEILPKTATWAGFELSTGIPISTIEPEKAAAYLRKQ